MREIENGHERQSGEAERDELSSASLPRSPLRAGIYAVTALAGLVAAAAGEPSEPMPAAATPAANPYASRIPDTPEMRATIRDLSTYDFLADLGAKEARHAALVERQMIANALELYRAEEKGDVRIYLAEVAKDGEQTARDMSSGPALLVVKRFEKDLPDGKRLTVFVNERWAIDSESPESSRQRGGLFLPDEIRIHAIAFDGARGMPGSEKLHVFDRWRVLWDVENRPHLFRQEVYGAHDAAMAARWREAAKDGRYEAAEIADLTDPNERLAIRVPLGATSCMGCHRTGNSFTLSFFDELKAPSVSGPENAQARRDLVRRILGENDNESIVPRKEFEKPFPEHRGAKEYLDYLRANDYPNETIERVAEALKDPGQSLRVPGMAAMLERMQNDPAAPLVPVLRPDSAAEHYRGNTVRVPRSVYTDSEGAEMVEGYAPELDSSLLLGQGAWWDVPVVFPPRE